MNGHLDTLIWLNRYATFCWDGKAIQVIAARYGRIDVLDWLNARGIPSARVLYDPAAKGGHIAVLQWALEHGHPWDRQLGACVNAATNGHFECLKWLVEHNYPYGRAKCIEHAVRFDHAEIVKYLLEIRIAKK